MCQKKEILKEFNDVADTAFVLGQKLRKLQNQVALLGNSYDLQLRLQTLRESLPTERDWNSAENALRKRLNET